MGCEGANVVGDERDVEAEHSCGVAYAQFTYLAWRERDAYASGVAETEVATEICVFKPPPLPRTTRPRAAHDLTGHRSVIPELAQAKGCRRVWLALVLARFAGPSPVPFPWWYRWNTRRVFSCGIRYLSCLGCRDAWRERL